MSQLHQLEKVLTFYQQQLEFIKTKFKAQANVVEELRVILRQLEQELTSTQERSSAAESTAVNFQMTCFLMERIGVEIRRNQIQHAEQTEKLETLRTELRTQMSKIEALEKVVANKATTIEHLRRRTEQHLADERYLNTHFYGSTK